ncbi:Choline transporter-like protein, partial [Globisporangium splendens]
MAVVAILAVHTGKPLSLVYGKEYNGDVCGDGNLTDRQLTAYPRLDQDLLVALTAGVNDITTVQFFGVCVASCPMAGTTTCTYDNSSCWVAAQDSRAVLFRRIPVDSQNETVLAETCVDPVGADPECTNSKFVNGECSQVCHTKRVQKSVWKVEATTPNPLMEQLQGNLQVLGRFFNDMSAAKWFILLAGGVGAMMLGLVWLLVLQFFAGCMVWLTCFLVLLVLVLMSLFCSFRAGIIDADALSGLAFLENATSSDSSMDGLSLDDLTASTDSSSKLQLQVASYMLWFVTALVFVVLVAMHKRIHIAIAIIKESSKAIKTMPMLLLWPLVPTLLFVALVIYSVAIAACLISSEDLTSAVKDTTASSLSLLSSVSANATASIDTSALTSQSAKTTQQVLLSILTGPVTSPMALVLVSCVLAWLVASTFANVYDAAIDTILLCFCLDTDMNGEGASEHMSNELKRIMGGRTTSHKVIHVGGKAANENSSNPQAQQQAGTSNKVHIETEI